LPDEVIVEIMSLENYGVESDGEFTVGLPKEVTEELREEGFCRELVHQIQNLRKEADFKIENTIILAIIAENSVIETIKHYRDYILKETLSRELINDIRDSMFVKEVEINNKNLKIGIEVSGSIS
jgi:isoleucyl-tRNA synthetase